MVLTRLQTRVAAMLIGLSVASCSAPPQTVLERLVDARRVSGELLIQFEKELEASNRAVMANTDDASATAVRDAQQATQGIQTGSQALAGLLTTLDYAPERAALQEFSTRFEEFQTLDREILDLAALDTNIKAQRLSFGTAQEAATRFAAALEPVRSSDSLQARVWADDAVAALREIQVLEAPHIAEAQDAAMDRIEERMREEEATVRKSLSTLSTTAAGRPAAQKASEAFETFIATHAEILKLSHQNSNVRSLALSLGKKRTLAAQCEERLRALQQLLTTRNISAGAR